MAKSISFTGRGRQPLGGSRIQRDYATDPRRLLAQSLMQTGSSTAPVQSMTEGLARALSGGLGGYFAGQARQDMKSREQAQASEMAAVLGGYGAQPWTPPAGESIYASKEDADVGGAVVSPELAASRETVGGMAGALAAMPAPQSEGAQQMLMALQGQDAERKYAANLLAGQRAYDRGLRRDQYAREDIVREDEQAAAQNLATAKAGRDAGKFGTPYAVADPNSSTGYALQRTNQKGDVETLGEAKPPRKYFDPDAEKNKAKYKGTRDRYETANTQVAEADQVASHVAQMLDLVGKVNSGTLAGTKLAFRKLGAAIGWNVDVSAIANAETMQSKGMDFILERIQKTKGAISEKEMAAFKAASAGLGNTAEGNRLILALAGKVSDRMKFEANAVREAYGASPDISLKELDDVGHDARLEFGSVVPDSDSETGAASAEWDYIDGKLVPRAN